jgi:hypothetical protein
MMQPADEGLRYDASDPLDGSRSTVVLALLLLGGAYQLSIGVRKTA